MLPDDVKQQFAALQAGLKAVVDLVARQATPVGVP